MADFTYECPNNEEFYSVIKAVVKSQFSRDKDLCELVGAGRCDFYSTTDFSQKRWNAYNAEVRFYIPISIYSKHNSIKLETMKHALLDICKQIMPSDAGYDISKVSISPSLEPTPIEPLEIIKEVVSDEKYLRISDDLIEKGKRMANAYVTLFALENHIRNYIDIKLSEKMGNDYMALINVPKKVKAGIEMKKREEQSRKWLPVRGDKDLYYVDFIELADIIVNNWDCFKDDIPSQEWIKVKMQEMYDLRCLIAHNSYISDDNIQLLESTTKQIISQLLS